MPLLELALAMTLYILIAPVKAHVIAVLAIDASAVFLSLGLSPRFE